MESTKKDVIKTIVASSIFGALAIILYCVPGLQFSIPFMPTFLKIHFDEIPILIAGYAYNIWTAIIIIIVKGLFKLITDIPATGGIGTMIDIVYSLAFVLPSVIIYKKMKTKKGAIISLIVGTLSQLLFSSVIGLYAFYPLYGFFYFPQSSNYSEAMQNIGSLFRAFDSSITTAANPKVIIEFLLPFNLIKDVIVCLFVFIVYKPLKFILEN